MKPALLGLLFVLTIAGALAMARDRSHDSRPLELSYAR